MRQTCCQQQHLPLNHVNSSNHQFHHHNHHHLHQPCHAFPSSTLAPTSASASSGTAVAGGVSGVTANGGATCCLPPSHSYHTTLFNGTATLPASYSSTTGGSDHFASSSSSSSCSYYRSRSTGPNHHQQPHHCTLPPASCVDQQNGCTQYSSWLPFSRRAIALFALSLVFILIWSSVVSFVLLTDSFKGQQTTKQTAELFELHRDVGQLAFEVGEEMCKLEVFNFVNFIIYKVCNQNCSFFHYTL